MSTDLTSVKGASAQAIRQHYDVGVEFFALWLDPSLTYSCALWAEADGDDLQRAQLRKIDHHIDTAVPEPAERVLDIGCGWGSALARLASRARASRAVGLTLSRDQHAYVRRHAEPAVEVHLEGWEQHAPARPYDAIISIGALEHFARYGLTRRQKLEAYRAFFRKCWSLTTGTANLSLQSVVYEDYDESKPSHLIVEVFPESDLPRLADLLRAAERRFEVLSVRNDRSSYERTLRVWHRNLRRARTAAVDLAGEAVFKQYLTYLGAFLTGFNRGTVNLSRIALRRIPGRGGG